MRRPRAITSSLDFTYLSRQDLKDITEQFWPRVYKNRPGGCWAMGDTRSYWPSKRHPVFTWKHRTYSARQFSWAVRYRHISAGMYLWSTCGIPNCVNPAHMLYGTRQEMEHWFDHRPQLTPEQVNEALRLYRQERKTITELRQQFGLTDREMRKVLQM